MDDRRTVTVRFPIFLVVQQDCLGLICPFVVKVEKRQAIVLFAHRELGELFIEQQSDDADSQVLNLQPVSSDVKLRKLIGKLPSRVTHALWDTTAESGCFKLIETRDLSESSPANGYFTK